MISWMKNLAQWGEDGKDDRWQAEIHIFLYLVASSPQNVCFLTLCCPFFQEKVEAPVTKHMHATL
jgi:hypothetical protein